MRVQKQNDGIKAFKNEKRRKKTSAVAAARLRIANDIPREDVISFLMEHYGYASSTSDKIYAKAAEWLIRTASNDINIIRDKNLKRLDTIAQSAAETDDYSNAIKALDTMNKMIGIYTEKKEVKVSGDEPFVIKLGE